MYLTIPIPQEMEEEIKVQDCLEAFLEKEILDGNEMW